MVGKRKLPPQSKNLHSYFASTPKRPATDPLVPTKDAVEISSDRPLEDSSIIHNDDKAGRPFLKISAKKDNPSKPAATAVSTSKTKREMPIPKKLDRHDVMLCFDTKTRITSIIKNNLATAFGDKIIQLKFILEDFIKESLDHQDTGKWAIVPKDLVGSIGDGPGLYLEQRTDKTGTISVYIGMSFTSMAERNKIKESELAAVAFTLNDLEEMNDEKWIQQIQMLRLPGICFEEPNNEEAMIRLQLGELLLAVSHECITKRVAERLRRPTVSNMQWPKLFSGRTMLPSSETFLMKVPSVLALGRLFQ